MPVCANCSKSLATNRALSVHLVKDHHVSPQEYYDLVIGRCPGCANCGKATTFEGMSKGYTRHCSQRCAQKVIQNRPENIIKKSQVSRRTMLRLNSDPAYVAQKSLTMKRLHSDPEFAERHRERGRKRFTILHQDPEFRRKVGSRNNLRGWHSSPKSGEVYYRSSYESRAYEILDADDDVVSYQYEPVSIPYLSIDGSTKNYYPDLMVQYRGGRSILVEIKPRDLVNTEVNQAKADAAIAWCDERNIEFTIWTEQQLFPQPN